MIPAPIHVSRQYSGDESSSQSSAESDLEQRLLQRLKSAGGVAAVLSGGDKARARAADFM